MSTSYRTERLYYQNSYIAEFEATVVACEPKDGIFLVTLDRTAFFPEGGGQPADIGTLGDAKVLDAHERGGEVLHYTDRPLEVGAVVVGKLDFDRRFRLMQNHGGEHIVSGLINRRFGLNNVGFHMGSEDITVDYDGPLDRKTLLEIELDANRLVCKNLPVKCWYPTPDELKELSYRSKKALEGDIRIVEIEDCDRCACCAPHLARTGEIGIIKLLDVYNYKGGVRVHLHCGLDALDDYNRKYDAVRTIATSMSVSQSEIVEAFNKIEADFAACRADAAKLRIELLSRKVKDIEPTEGNLCLFESGLAGDDLRRFALAVSEKCSGICAVFSGEDGAYNYVIASKSRALRSISRAVNAALNGRGGGSDEMLQGRVASTEAVIKEFFENGKFD